MIQPVRTGLLVLAAAAAALTAPTPLAAEGIPFGDGWQTYGARAAIQNGVLEVGNGGAVRRDLSLEDGTIELEVELSGLRSFVYLMFRMADDANYEELYLRPHKSRLPDALQYTPVYRGISSWQLYHGPGYTAAAELPAGEWTRIRLVVEGTRAAVFVGAGDEPELVIPLVRAPQPGYVAVRGFVPPGNPATWSARFRNVEVRRGRPAWDFSGAPAAPTAPPGTIASWSVSETFVPPAGAPVEAIPEEVEAGSWQEIAAEPSGMVLMSRHRERPPEASQWTVAARTSIAADQPRVQRLELGYSDEVSVFLNGRLLFVADDSYSFDAPRREGLIGLDQAALYLPLQEGANELVLAVTDRFGGWGWIARLP